MAGKRDLLRDRNTYWLLGFGLLGGLIGAALILLLVAPPRGEAVELLPAPTPRAILVPGIGPVIAQAIIDYRNSHGGFQEPAEIQNVAGIGPATFERIEHLISTGQ